MNNKVESLYLHFPFCKHLCNYCDFFKKVPVNSALEINDFHSYMDNAIVEHKKLMSEHGLSWGELKTLYIGGGTPSLWGEAGSHYLKNLLNSHQIKLNSECEFTLEVNPASWTKESIESWESIGVNRFSLGIQSLQAESIKYLDRIHNINDVLETLEYFKSKKVNYSMDFMLGLPFSEENKRDVVAELVCALKYNPSHFSVYILTVKDNYPHFKNLPTEEWIETEYMDIANFLKSNGFNHYEVSNFAKDGFESKHNLCYWKSASVAALGPSATGFFSEKKLRYKWKTKEAQFDLEELSDEAFLLEKIYMSLRSSEGLDINLIKNKSAYLPLISLWEKKGYLQSRNDEKIFLNTQGYLLLDSLMNDLFALDLA